MVMVLKALYKLIDEPNKDCLYPAAAVAYNSTQQWVQYLQREVANSLSKWQHTEILLHWPVAVTFRLIAKRSPASHMASSETIYE